MSGLDDACREVATMLDFHLEGAEFGQSPVSQAADVDGAILHYQAIGICELLLDAEVDAFFHHLIRGAQVRKWFLEQARTSAGFPERSLRASNGNGIFGAIAAFQWPLARDIAALSPGAWMQEVEYEDDFAHMHFIHRYLASAPPTELADIVNRFEKALEGGPSPRLALCKAVLARDPDAGAEAITALIDGHRAELAHMKKFSLYATEDLFLPLSAIYVEGLAWLSLLETAGVVLPGEYTYCPSLARRKNYAPFEVTTFPRLPL